MKTRYTRKIVLLSVIAVLLVVYILQLVSASRTNVKILLAEGDIDYVLIDNNGSKLAIAKEGDGWVVGQDKLPCQLNRANGIVNAISEIKVLGNVASGSAADNERYGFDSGITVEAYSNTKLIRSLVVGKNTATGSQCYARIDGKSTVNLVQGALRSTFEATAADIIEKAPEKTQEPEEPAETEQSLM